MQIVIKYYEIIFLLFSCFNEQIWVTVQTPEIPAKLQVFCFDLGEEMSFFLAVFCVWVLYMWLIDGVRMCCEAYLFRVGVCMIEISRIFSDCQVEVVTEVLIAISTTP